MTDPSAAQFDRVAAAYATSAVHATGADLIWLIEALQPQPAWQALDLGTGAGHAALAVAPRVATITAIDVAERMLATARRLAVERGQTNISFERADVSALPFAAATFDAAFSRFSAHHWRGPAAALRQAARVLRAGAPLALIDTISPDQPAEDTFINTLELLRDASHARDARTGEWQDRLSAAGFALQAVREWSLDLVTEEWLARSATPPWRADACRRLLIEAPDRARERFSIAPDGSRFSLPCALILARRT